jgi:hypothetical protein
MVASLSLVTAHMMGVIHRRRRRHHQQAESVDTLKKPQISIVRQLMSVSKSLRIMVITRLQLIEILIKSVTFCPLPDRGLSHISRGRDHIDNPRKRAMVGPSAKKKKMRNDISGSIQKSPMLTGMSFVACLEPFSQRLIIPSRRW